MKVENSYKLVVDRSKNIKFWTSISGGINDEQRYLQGLRADSRC